MIKSVTVTNHLGESLKMDLFEPEASGLLVSNISGIGAPDASLNITSYASSDGGHFTSGRANTRTITLVLMPLWQEKQSIEAARQLTYRYFPIRHEVTVAFETDNHDLEIKGWVKQNDPDIFQEQEKITVVIECPTPWFDLVGRDTVVVFNGTDPNFEFPFANNKTQNDEIDIVHKEYDEFGRVINEWTEHVVLENTKGLLKMGEVRSQKSQVITYDGEIEAGFIITIQAKEDNISNIIVWKQETSEFIRIDTSKIAAVAGTPFSKGDSMQLSTIAGNRYLKIMRGNGATNIINALDLNSTWIQLTTGINTFWYSADSGVDDMSFKIEYKTAYQGV